MNKEKNFTTTLLTASLLYIALGLSAAPASAQELRVFLNERCIVSDEPIVVADLAASKGLPFAGLFVSDAGQAVITGLVRGIAWGLASLSSRRDYFYTTSQDLYLYHVDYATDPQPELNRNLSCMTLVAGRFSRDSVDCIEDYEPLVLSESSSFDLSLTDIRRGRSSANVLRRANICLDGEPDLLIENRVVLSEDESAFRLQGAGREINRLLSTNNKKAERGMLLTASLFSPAPDGRGRHLSTHWINYGSVTPSGRIDEFVDGAISSWTPVPSMNDTVMANYATDSAAYRAAHDNASALEREILRQSRQVSAMESLLDDADTTLAPVLEEQIDNLSGQIVFQGVALDAWREEYEDLPGGTYQYMPVTLQLTLTETRDEKRALQILAELLDRNSRSIAEAIVDSGR